ncbi:MAG: ammonia-forming cytochrome c nitrite reductase subunit c552 [Halochromatium sp.]
MKQTPTGARRHRPSHQRGRALIIGAVFVFALLATLVVTSVLITMFSHKQDARQPFVRVVEVDEITTDPEPWGKNWPHQFDGWKSTSGAEFYGGSSAMPQSKLEAQPWLKRLYAGYAFSIDYREARGHAYMLYDQGVTERVTQKPQAGACLHCHGSVNVLYRRVGLEAQGEEVTQERLAAELDMPAMIRGFQELSQQPYQEVLALLYATPDGTPGENEPVFPTPPPGGFTGEYAGEALPEDHARMLGEAHPVSCVDCHDPKSMAVRVTRPGFMLGIAALAEGDGAVPHLPSIEQWRQGDRREPYDPNELASRQEMRSFVCGQCHVEYYCATKDTLTFPWAHGLGADDAERVWEEKAFPDGSAFYDYAHGETGAKVFKVQHPEFELWSQGIHARSGVACADCHMPYERKGAMKVSNHNVRSPMNAVNSACQTCHNVPEDEIKARVDAIQNRTVALTERAGAAMTEMLDAILEAKAGGASEAELEDVFELQRKAMWRLDYISSENSKGFHADQESARILAESIDYSRQAQSAALRLRAPEAPSTEDLPTEPVKGVTPTGESPAATPEPVTSPE